MRATSRSLFALLILVPLVAVLSWPSGTMSPVLPAPRPADALRISDIQVGDITEKSAVVTWRTDRPADSQVVWQKDASAQYASPNLPQPVEEHVVTVDRLRGGTHYDFYVISQTQEGQIASIQGPGFKTEGLAPFDDLCERPTARRMKQLPALGTGIAWGDFDNDGDLDVFIGCERMFGAKLFRRNERVFADVTELEASGFGGSSRSAAWADFDGDGDLDLLVCRRNGIGLYANQGPPNWRFVDVSGMLPAQKAYDAEGAGWIDYNNDGQMDILVTNGNYGILVFENQFRKSKTFADVSKQAGLGPGGAGTGFGDYVAIADYDRDGRTDFLYNLLTGMLFHNDGGVFTRATKSGVTYFCSSTRKLGAVFGDYDNDGRMDLFVPQRGKSKLYHNEGNGAFTDAIDSSGDLAKNQEASVGAWGDVDNDGDLDLYVGNEGALNRLFINVGNGKFEDRTEVYGVAASEGRPRGMCFVDYDGDGDLDLYVHNYAPPDHFFENGLIGPSNHNYLKVKFPPRPCPVGARVSLHAEGKEKPLAIREISGGEGWGSQPPPEAHFGAAPGSYVVKVVFTNGAAKEIPATVSPTGRNTVLVK